MEIDQKWRSLGYGHVTWEILRYFLSIRGKNNQKLWLRELKTKNSLSADRSHLPIEQANVELFFEYLDVREKAFNAVFPLLRDETAATEFCTKYGIEFGKTSTKSRDHHQASKALVATVTAIATWECDSHGITIDSNPQTRCIWCNENGLHVTARNLDGAVPSTVNPVIIWEIKEYWGKTSGGSKMSDAVYECNLVGRELRDFERRAGVSVVHAVFVDGKDQWTSRKSDLRRFVDLHHQGLIDLLFVGEDVESRWQEELRRVILGQLPR